ncbi:MAG: hypothetical protein QQN54_03675 [Nitrosopumilus sp.]
MNKAVIIGIAVSGIIIGILAVLSLDLFSILEDDDVSEPILVIEEEETKNESKPQGRNFSIELDEKMGLSAP